MRHEVAQFIENVFMQEVSATALLCKIEFEDIESMYADRSRKTSGPTGSFDKERASNRAEVSLLGTSVSAVLFRTDIARK